MSTPYIGILTDASNYPFIGQISNFRVTNTAVYDSTLTWLAVPASPLTAISGTQLLTFQSTTIVDNSANALALTNNGSVSVQPASPFGIQLQTPAVDYLVVAGGGGSGFGLASGGGAGGLLQGSVSITTGSPITVTIGGGGPSPQSSGVGNSGSNSVFSNITTFGGGGGGSWAAVAGASGGSGGGGASTNGTFVSGGQGVFGQGNAGGSITSLYGYHISGAGGGGAGTPGGGGPNLTNIVDQGAYGYAGGTGVSTAIIGPVYAFAGGGGGFAYGDGIGIATGGAGGAGGGGGGGCAAGATIVYAQGGVGYNSGGTPSAVWNSGNGGTNTGGGAGGASIVNGGAGGAGGSGIVVVSYPDIYAAAAATTGSPAVSTSGSGNIQFGVNGKNTYTQENSYLSVTGVPNLTGDFTVEWWYYLIAATGTQSHFSNFTGSNAANCLAIYNGGSGLYGEIGNGSTSVATIANGSLLTNTWYHVAISRSGSTARSYINGTLNSTVTTSASITGSPIGVGAYPGGLSGLYPLQGYVSNLRVVNGTALYTSNFTPSTTPLTAISGTVLLLSAVSGAPFIDGSPNNSSVLRTAGTQGAGSSLPAWNQASPFATGLGYKNRVYTYNSSGTITF